MAAGRHPSRLFVVAQDYNVLGNLVFDLNLKYLFSQRSHVPDEREPEPEPPLLRSLPEPVACFKPADLVHNLMAFAASPDGQVIAAIGYNGQTLLYDAAAGAVSPGPDMHTAMVDPHLVPVGDRMFFAISGYPRVDELYGRQRSRFEALQQNPRTGGWAWTAVPDPPGPRRDREDLGAYFVSGARVYVSLRRQGTYSYDTLRRRWRTEGAWELPVIKGRAVLVRNFLGTGRQLLFGFRNLNPLAANDEFPLCAVDMDARPSPSVVGCWPKAARFSSQAWRAGYNLCPQVSQLNYFGGGRFCISVTSHMSRDAPRGAVSFMAVELSRDLQLLKLQYSCYVLPESARGVPANVLLSN